MEMTGRHTVPRFDRVRTGLGYRFPRFGPLAFKWFYKRMPAQCRVQLFPEIFDWLADIGYVISYRDPHCPNVFFVPS